VVYQGLLGSSAAFSQGVKKEALLENSSVEIVMQGLYSLGWFSIE